MPSKQLLSHSDISCLLDEIYQLYIQAYYTREMWFGDTLDMVVIGAVLTQNTNWKNVEYALDNLRALHLNNLKSLATLSPEYLSTLIRPTGYHRQKSIKLIEIATHLTTDVLPDDPHKLRDYLLRLHGIGNETADAILCYGFNLPFFVIDAYTIRIFSRLGFCSPSVKYRELQDWFVAHIPLDLSLYQKLHALITAHAKSACTKVPRCPLCPLSHLCDYYHEVYLPTHPQTLSTTS